MVLNIRTSIYHYFVVVSMFVRPKASGCAHVARGPCTNAAREKRKRTRGDVPTIILIAVSPSVKSRLRIWVVVKTVMKS